MENLLKLIKLPLLGKENPPYKQRRMTDEEMKRNDIDRSKLYLVMYNEIWLIGRFSMVHFGWIFHPNLGCMTMQINDLQAIFEIIGLEQNESGSTAEFIMSYL